MWHIIHSWVGESLFSFGHILFSIGHVKHDLLCGILISGKIREMDDGEIFLLNNLGD